MRIYSPLFITILLVTIVFQSCEQKPVDEKQLARDKITMRTLGLAYLEENKLDLLLDQTAKIFLVEKGFDEKFGARPLKRAIQKYIEDPLAEEILRGSFKEGTKIIAKHVEDAEELVFYDESLEKESPSEEPEKSDMN